MKKAKSILRLHKVKQHPKYEAFIQTKPMLALFSIFRWPRQQIRRLYGWVVAWAETKQAEKALGGIAFAESSFFPIPPDPLLIAMTIAQPKKYLRFAAICTLGSIVGGIIGYTIGWGLYETVGQWIIDTYHLQESFEALGIRYSDNAFLTIFTAAFTPIPYKLITIAAGVFQVNIFMLIIASLLGRGGRFFLVATLLHHFGQRYKDKIERYIDVISIVFVLLIVLGLFAIKLLA